jgi:hypothetical protein
MVTDKVQVVFKLLKKRRGRKNGKKEKDSWRCTLVHWCMGKKSSVGLTCGQASQTAVMHTKGDCGCTDLQHTPALFSERKKLKPQLR